MSKKRTIETSSEEPSSKLNKVADFDSSRNLIDENESLKKKIAELEKRDEDAQKMSKEMNEKLMKRVDDAESKVFISDSKLSMIKHLTQNKYIVNQGFGGKTHHNLSQEIIDVIFKNDKNSELPREEMRRTPVIKYKNFVIYYMNKNTVFYEKPKVRPEQKFADQKFSKPKFGETSAFGKTQ
jgi:hypothetical protein